jgi:hypothetical protein
MGHPGPRFRRLPGPLPRARVRRADGTPRRGALRLRAARPGGRGRVAVNRLHRHQRGRARAGRWVGAARRRGALAAGGAPYVPVRLVVQYAGAAAVRALRLHESRGVPGLRHRGLLRDSDAQTPGAAAVMRPWRHNRRWAGYSAHSWRATRCARFQVECWWTVSARRTCRVGRRWHGWRQRVEWQAQGDNGQAKACPTVTASPSPA